jgi:sortase A
MDLTVRQRLSRWAGGFAGGLALVAGFVLVAEALLTVSWHDPITSVFAQRDQAELRGELAASEGKALPPRTRAVVTEAGSSRLRMAVLARDLRRRTEAGEPLGRIAVPRMDASFVFVAGTGKASLRRGPGHYAGTALPGERGTVAIAGHRTTYAAPFRRLDRMRPGDRITLTMRYGRFSYAVEGSRVVAPGNVNVLRNLRHDRLVLTTCTPMFSAAKRLLITARLMQAVPRGAAARVTPRRRA